MEGELRPNAHRGVDIIAQDEQLALRLHESQLARRHRSGKANVSIIVGHPLDDRVRRLMRPRRP